MPIFYDQETDMNISLENALEYARDNREKFLVELIEFVKIPSVSTNPENRQDIQRAAEWVSNQLDNLALENIQIMPTPGHPVVFAESLKAGKDKPTVLIYGHYDVQPADPIELWKTPPFEATQKGENLYGRGASDMKGQIMVSLKAIEAIIQQDKLPFNVKFLIEGEEEIGSPNLEEFISNNKSLLRCDFVINPDGSIISADLPTITYGLRGLAYFELRIIGPDHDLHSGTYGGVVNNPAQVLSELIAGMHDENGKVTLPGFYDKVRRLDEDERNELGRLPLDESFYKSQTGTDLLWGEKGFTPYERIGIRPTLEINGILSGFTGEGSKTVLPFKAMAKISMRLVPDQDPFEVKQQLADYLERNTPPTVTWELTQLSCAYPSVTDRSAESVKALEKAMHQIWGKQPVYRREGGTVPIVAQMQRVLGVDSVITGFGLPDDNLHAPNEKIHVPTFYNGIDTFIRYYYLLGSGNNSD
jgi:acetylornithine deacetylase/succinyl-diaminopimelate desuccinylase-like protein